MLCELHQKKVNNIWKINKIPAIVLEVPYYLAKRCQAKTGFVFWVKLLNSRSGSFSLHLRESFKTKALETV